MLSLPPHTAPVLNRADPFSEDSMRGHYFWSFVCREEERVHLADVIMPFRNMTTALCWQKDARVYRWEVLDIHRVVALYLHEKGRGSEEGIP